ncbi:MAG: hypothetical protein H0X62_05180 [Bacteroidetes bacterium]|nr:hypothetical protein [Bacteroidota bacterium]
MIQKQIKIVILEDSEFYNSILTKQIRSFTEVLAESGKVAFDIQSYTYAQDCLRNLKEDVNIVFSDYYLGNGTNASDVLKQVKEICGNCQFVVLSQTEDESIVQKLIDNGAFAVLHKDRDALPKSCMIIEDILAKLI